MWAGSCSLWRGGWRRGPESWWTSGYRPSCHGSWRGGEGSEKSICLLVLQDDAHYRQSGPHASLAADQRQEPEENPKQQSRNWKQFQHNISHNVHHGEPGQHCFPGGLTAGWTQYLTSYFNFSFHVVSVYSSKQSPPFPLGTDREFLTRISIHLSHSNCIQLCFFTV